MGRCRKALEVDGSQGSNVNVLNATPYLTRVRVVSSCIFQPNKNIIIMQAIALCPGRALLAGVIGLALKLLALTLSRKGGIASTPALPSAPQSRRQAAVLGSLRVTPH